MDMVNRESGPIKLAFTAFGKQAITLRQAFAQSAHFIGRDSPIDSTAGAA
jgi:hypothetical protein